jgi:hypothetical protein
MPCASTARPYVSLPKSVFENRQAQAARATLISAILWGSR